jgi:hypothetical protein
MISRICCFLCVLVVSSGIFAQDTLSVVERPQSIKNQMAQRGMQDQAAPVLAILEPKNGAKISGSTVKLKLGLSGDLKGYHPHKDPATNAGNHIHVILDNQPYEAHYSLETGFELRNVAAGKHTIRVFASRPWHESYKNNGSFQMVSFTVTGGGDASKPTTTASGQMMGEGKDFPTSQAGMVNAKKPLLTYSRPKGEYKGDDPIMIDFWLANAKLKGDGGKYQVRYSIDGGAPKMLDKWEPIWVSGWSAGKHSIKLELVDQKGNVIDNGGYNATTREITVVK